MANAKVQTAAMALDRHCAELGLRALIGLSPEGALIVYAQNRKNFRRASKILPKTWHDLPCKVMQYSKKS